MPCQNAITSDQWSTKLHLRTTLPGVMLSLFVGAPMSAEELTRAENVVLGIVAGILTSALLATAGLLLGQIVIPAYKRMSYGGIDLAGKWSASASEYGANYVYTITVKQSAHKLTGTANIRKTTGVVTEYNDTFEIIGTSWEGFVSLTFRSIDRKRLSFATALLRIEDRGGRLVGHWLYRSGATNDVQTEALTLYRDH